LQKTFYEKGVVYFIDFGLSFFSKKIEDMAVDLHLLKQAIQAKHIDIPIEDFQIVLDSYDSKEVSDRLNIVEARGRNKHK
jgi:TP53 regulating kinase-like protein